MPGRTHTTTQVNKHLPAFCWQFFLFILLLDLQMCVDENTAERQEYTEELIQFQRVGEDEITAQERQTEFHVPNHVVSMMYRVVKENNLLSRRICQEYGPNFHQKCEYLTNI